MVAIGAKEVPGVKRLAAGLLVAATIGIWSLTVAPSSVAKTTTLTYMYWWTGQQDRDFATQTIEAFEKANPGVRVKIIHQVWAKETDYAARILTMTAANTSPDVIALPFHLLPRFVERGLLEPVDAYLARDSVKLESWMPVGQSAVKRGKKSWGLPYTGSSWWVTYNRRVLSELGLPDLETLVADGNWNWNVLSELATKATKRGAGGKVDRAGIGTFVSFKSVLPFVLGFGGEMFAGENPRPTLNRPEVIRGVDYMADLLNVKRSVNMYADPLGSFVTSKVAMLLWWDSISAYVQVTSKGQLQINQVPFPPGPANARDIHAEYHAITMASQSKHKQEAWKLAKWITNKESTARMAAVCGYFVPRYDSLPTYRSMWQREGLTGRSRFLEEAASRTEMEPRFPKFTLVYGKLDELLDAVYQGKTSAAAAMDEAQRYAQAMMK